MDEMTDEFENFGFEVDSAEEEVDLDPVEGEEDLEEEEADEEEEEEKKPRLPPVTMITPMTPSKYISRKFRRPPC
ncbi:hypothetical protein DSOUD_1952 [Desulfuromonas soudanensis]|uniref:Uncharacterized protein n=1 Tax=Desulfuromonas soudanensis TaxID=1603606 RepID=A0A0M4D6T6_9BACT|nr:hypothetical protein [Desulfuromonas soudanensis]ALC16722.1 hypothetical protein DSOUD_1952 [Desulfuromonas soudanensis]